MTRKGSAFAATVLGCMVFASGVAGTPTAAQEIRAVGGFGGQADSRQLWRGGTETSGRKGALVGAFVDVELPAPGLSILVEGYFVRRGSRVSLEGGDPDAPRNEPLEARTDRLVFPLTVVGRAFRSPIGAFVYAGPAVEYVLSVAAAQPLEPAYRDQRQAVLSGVAGLGIELLVRDRWSLRAEARVVEGLTEIFDGSRGGIRHRATEIVVRVGFRPPREDVARSRTRN